MIIMHVDFNFCFCICSNRMGLSIYLPIYSTSLSFYFSKNKVDLPECWVHMKHSHIRLGKDTASFCGTETSGVSVN
jgi:hypothetical protein